MAEDVYVSGNWLLEKVSQLRLAARATHDPNTSASLKAMATAFAEEVEALESAGKKDRATHAVDRISAEFTGIS